MGGSEFHEFDASSVGIVEIELPFAVTADLWLFGAVPAVCPELPLGGVNVGNPEGDVVHHPKSVLVGVGGDVEHVFKPVGAVRDLHVDPVAFLVLHATVPVDMEAEDVFVEFVFGGAIANDEASVNQASANLTAGSRELAVSGRLQEVAATAGGPKVEID